MGTDVNSSLLRHAFTTDSVTEYGPSSSAFNSEGRPVMTLQQLISELKSAIDRHPETANFRVITRDWQDHQESDISETDADFDKHLIILTLDH